MHQRTLIVLEEGAQAEVWEQYLSADEELVGVFNVVTELVVSDNAHLRYVCGQNLSEKSWIFGAQRARSAAMRRSTGSRSASAQRAAGADGDRLGGRALTPG